MNLTATREGIVIALEALRSNKVRAALTILGIVIGVATVMTMAAAISGFRSTVLEAVQSSGPKNFQVDRFSQTAIQVDDGTGKSPWEGKPPLTFAEAELIAELPSVRAVIPALFHQGEARAGSRTTGNVMVLGQGWRWTEYTPGDFERGRNYLADDEERAASVAVISADVAEQLFPGQNAVGKRIRLDNEQLTVVGVYRLEDNLFASAMKTWIRVPPSTMQRRLGVSTDFMSIFVVTASHASQDEAIDDVTAALRSARGLRPGAESNFAITRPEEITQAFNQITFVFFIVMLVLSSIGLIVGGVGVVGIMMISVTERTREIGVRKALGATRREILWQFLVESTTVTVIGGAVGMVVAALLTMLVRAVTPVPAAIPAWAIMASMGMAAIGGIFFGLYPANKAARLDPVEALRYE